MDFPLNEVFLCFYSAGDLIYQTLLVNTEAG